MGGRIFGCRRRLDARRCSPANYEIRMVMTLACFSDHGRSPAKWSAGWSRMEVLPTARPAGRTPPEQRFFGAVGLVVRLGQALWRDSDLRDVWEQRAELQEFIEAMMSVAHAGDLNLGCAR